jgi:hypothetical protein
MPITKRAKLQFFGEERQKKENKRKTHQHQTGSPMDIRASQIKRGHDDTFNDMAE